MSCIDCTEPATQRGRCTTHHTAFEERPSVRHQAGTGQATGDPS
ncbi:hypothetical protein ABT160_46905 [Streptomyces sp. NPDC001941]